MSILIKGIEMPKNGELTIAFASDENGKNTIALVVNEKGKPIEHKGVVEIPSPHGRLIDADKLIAFITEELNRKEDPLGFDAIEILTEIEYAPTIIEAEVE